MSRRMIAVQQATLMPRSWIVRPGRERKTMKSKFERSKYKTTSPDSLGPRFDEYSPYQSSSFSVDLPIEYKCVCPLPCKPTG